MSTVSLDDLSNQTLPQAKNGDTSTALPEVNPHIHLSERDSQLFAELMEADEEPVEALRLAALEYQQKINRQSL